MSESTLTIELHNRQQAWVAIKDQLYPFMAHWLQSGKRLVLTKKCVKPRPSGRGRKARSPLGLLNPPPIDQRP